jgi:hypothetical protein
MGILRADHIAASDRTGFAINPLSKIYFMFTRPMVNAFHFTWIMNERSIIGGIVYLLIFGTWLLVIFFSLASRPLLSRIGYLAGILISLCLVYLPSLVVRENYASHRTMLALDMAVFFLVFTAILGLIKKKKYQLIISTVMGMLFVTNAWYNFRYGFLGPVKTEYEQVREYIETRYHPGITVIDFIRPPGDLFQRKYRIAASWDEFGLPSFFPNWVPDPFVRQVIFEKTGSRQVAEGLVIRNWPGKKEWSHVGAPPSPNTLVVDEESILR